MMLMTNKERKDQQSQDQHQEGLLSSQQMFFSSRDQLWQFSMVCPDIFCPAVKFTYASLVKMQGQVGKGCIKCFVNALQIQKQLHRLVQ